MKSQLLTLLFIVGFSAIAYTQKAPIKFGQISKEDLLNNVYALDTTAPAVVLCDYGYYTESRFQTIRILRIKILKKEGYEWANRTFSTDSKTDIRGITYNLENNEIVETKLKKESIFSTRITEDRFEMRIAMPNVKVGSIIDIQFMFDGLPYAWEFQQEIPVAHSELVIEPSRYISYNKNFFGYIGLTTNTNNRWVASFVPAFKPEPYMTSSKNYMSRFEFDYESISYPGYFKALATTWDAVRDMLYASTYFGSALEADGYLKSTAKDIETRSASQEEKIKMAYEYVKKIKWDKTERLFTEKTSLNSTLKEGKGNSSEINLLLVQLLRRLGLDADPVVMSTRSNGRLSPIRPSYNKLNYVIAAVISEKDTILLDATEQYCPYDMLPLRTLNGQAQLMNKNRTGWIDVYTNKKAKQMVIYNLSIEDNLSLKGNLTYLKSEYTALDFRNYYEDFNSDDEYITAYKEGKKGLKITSHTIKNLDSIYEPITEAFEVVITNSINEMDGELYIIPTLFDQIQENPFKVSERNYPIDFGYTYDKTILTNYNFPQGYTIVNLPVNTNMKLQDNTASFSSITSVTEGKISVIYKIKINKSLILQNEYSDFREFYNQILAKEAEPIVLKKN